MNANLQYPTSCMLSSITTTITTTLVHKVNKSGGKELNFCSEMDGNRLGILDGSGPE